MNCTLLLRSDTSSPFLIVFLAPPETLGLICSFTSHIIPKVTETCQKMKEHMYTIYDETSKEMEVMLQELCEVLESCTKLNSELEEASQALESLRGALAITQASEP